MKKIPDLTYSSIEYRGIKLYRDDIELILSILNENGFNVQIKDKTFEYESLDELIEKCGIIPSYFEISGEKEINHHTASVNLYFKRKEFRLYARADKESKLVSGTLRDVFEPKSTRLYKVLNPFIWYITIVLAAIFYPANFFTIRQAPFWVHSIFALCSALFIFSGLYRQFRHQVILKRKHEGGFWKRNADKIWLLVIGTIFGIILKFIFDAIWKIK